MIKAKKSPINEALCEFQFISDEEPDLTLPGLMYEKVRKKFPVKQQQVGFQMQFKQTRKGVEHTVEQAPARLQFFKKNKKTLIQVAPNLLVVNKLNPYSSWDKFKDMILENVEIYRSIAKPTGLKRIGLKYINQIDIPSEKVELSDYFKYYPFLPEVLGQNLVGFLSRVELSHFEGRDRLLLTLAAIEPKKPKTNSAILDLDYVMVQPEGIPLKKIPEWLESSHSVIKSAFESCITDKCKNLWEE